MIYAIDEERKAENIGEQDEFLVTISMLFFMLVLRDKMWTHLSDIAAYLPHCSQESYSCHPFLRTESCFPSKIMYMSDESFHDIRQASI